MKNQWWLSQIGTAVASVVLAVGLAGCAQDEADNAPGNTAAGGHRSELPTYGPWGEKESGAMATPAPAPARAAEKPAPAPQPAASGRSNAILYVPTGERSTSALMVEKSAPPEVVSGQTFDYDIRATNLTSQTLNDVVVWDSIPTGFRVATTSPTAKMEGGNAVFSVGTLAPHEAKSMKVTGAATGAGTLNNCISAEYKTAACVTINVVQPALKIVKTAPAEVTICDPIAVKIDVTNNGSGMARNVRVTDTFPAGLTTSDGKSDAAMDAGNLGPGQTRSFTLNLKASKPGSFTNTAKAVAEGGLTAESSPTTTVVKQPVLTLKAECPPASLIGRTLSFKFTVGNTGDMSCAGTSVSAPVPAGTVFVSADNGGTNNNGTVTWNVGSLNARDSKALTMVVRSSSAGEITASATARCTCSNQATDSCKTSTKGVPDIGTSVSDDNGVVLIGDTHVFHYTVKNQGQVDLTNVTGVATLDEGLDFVSTNFPGGANAAGRTLTFKMGTIKAGQTLNIDITVKGTKEGELVIQTVTKADQTREVRNDEQVNYIAR